MKLKVEIKQEFYKSLLTKIQQAPSLCPEAAYEARQSAPYGELLYKNEDGKIVYKDEWDYAVISVEGEKIKVKTAWSKFTYAISPTYLLYQGAFAGFMAQRLLPFSSAELLEAVAPADWACAEIQTTWGQFDLYQYIEERQRRGRRNPKFFADFVNNK